MKKIRKTMILLLAFITVFMMSQVAFAANYNGGTFTFDGTSINNSDAAADIDEAIANLQPGDSMTFVFEYKNESGNDTDWYLDNEVVNTLEQKITDGAKDGGYTYELVNEGKKEGKVTIFSSEAVAGDQDKNPDKDDEGLKAATNATDDWLYIDTLKNGQSGVTKLTVALDGESQANSYQSTKGQLKIAYGVENVAEGEIIYNHIPGKTVRTGDDANLLLPVLLLTLAAILLILTILSFKKDRKEGEEA